MDDIKIVSGNTEQEVWQLIEADLIKEDIFDYNTIIRQGNKEIELYIDIDLGGGFEGGSALTRFSAALSVADTFKFAVHDQDFIDQIGKFFGMQDVELGFSSLDKHLIIKTNNEEKVRQVFADSATREIFAELESFDCGIHTRTDEHHKKQTFLELNINEGINEPTELRKIYHAFYKVLTAIEDQE